MYFRPNIALILAIILMVYGGRHMILGAHHWHHVVYSWFHLMRWLWQQTSFWESTCYSIFWGIQGMPCTGSLCGTMIHAPVVIWQLVFIVFCFHILLICLYSWEALFREWNFRWRCPLGVWFSLPFMLYVSGEAMAKAWLPNLNSFLHMEWAIWRTWVLGGGISWLNYVMGKLGPYLEAILFQPKDINSPTIIINGERNKWREEN